jgi:hypothetical protein
MPTKQRQELIDRAGEYVTTDMGVAFVYDAVSAERTASLRSASGRSLAVLSRIRSLGGAGTVRLV